MSADGPNYYTLLGVGRNATPDEIRAAYQKLAFVYESMAVKTQEVQEQFKEMSMAYSVLSDPEKRAIYDQTLPPLPAGAAPVVSAGALGRTPWKVSDVVIGLGLAAAAQVVLYVVVAVGALFTMVTNGGTISASTDVLVFTAAQVGELLMFAVAWIFGVVKYRARWSALGFRRPAGGWSATGWLALAVFGMFTVSALYSVVVTGLGAKSFEPGPPLPSDLLTYWWSKAALILLAVVVAPFAEETFFRGFVFGGLNNRLGFWWGAVLSAALFALAHVSLAALVPIFFLGLMLAALYRRTGSIWVSMVAHSAYNGLAVLAFLTNMPF